MFTSSSFCLLLHSLLHSQGYTAAYPPLQQAITLHQIISGAVDSTLRMYQVQTPSFTSFLLDPQILGQQSFLTTAVCVSGYQAVSGGNQQVDQSAWSVSAVQGIGRQVPHGSQV